MEAIEKKECKRCGHQWWPKVPGRPFVCPKCHVPRWDYEARPYKLKEVTSTEEI